jgi:hypothetical protein
MSGCRRDKAVDEPKMSQLPGDTKHDVTSTLTAETSVSRIPSDTTSLEEYANDFMKTFQCLAS